MNTLVTGGAGFAGYHLLRALPREPGSTITATVLGEVPAGAEREVKGIEWLSMDLGSQESIDTVVGRTAPEVVYHLAGQASVGESFANPLATWEANATGTMRLMEALKAAPRRPRRVLVISSAEVYGATDADAPPISEDAPVRPRTPYGSSKLAAEIVALQVGRAAGIEVVVARSFNHIGPGQDERFVLPNMAGQLARMRGGTMEPVLHVGNIDVVRDFLDVRDVAHAYIVLMERGEGGETYNVCSGEGRSLRSVIELLVELSGTGATIEVDAERLRPVDIPWLVGDPRRLSAIGWAPRHRVEESLEDLLVEAESRA